MSWSRAKPVKSSTGEEQEVPMESYSAEDGEVEIEIDDAATSATRTAFVKEVVNYKRQTLQEVIDKSEGGKDVSGRMTIDTLKDFG